MKHIIALMMFLAAAGMLPAGDIEFQGMIRSYTGATFDTGDMLNEQTVDLTLRGWGGMSQILVNPYAYITADQEPEFGVREAYIDLFFPSPALDLRIGKQTVVWGQADGAFITDIVSPQDMRNFILADFSEIRKGVPAVRGTSYAGDVTFEAVWVPVFVPSSMPGEDSIWFDQPAGFADAGTAYPDRTIENSEIYGKVNYFSPGWSAEFMAAYAWDPNPSVSSADAAGPEEISYERYGVVGGSFSTTVSSVVLRSEAAAYLDRTFNTQGFGASTHHQFHGLLGADWSIGGVNLSAQYIMQYIHDFDESLLSRDLPGEPASELTHMLTARGGTRYFSDRLDVDLFAYIGLDPGNALIRPSVSWDVENGVILEAGAEVFLGDEGLFGRYQDNSLAYASLSWHF